MQLVKGNRDLGAETNLQSQSHNRGQTTLAGDVVCAVRTRATTGHLNLVQPPIPKNDPRKNFFSQRVVPHWNQLPNHVKMVQKTNDFKNAYDRHTGFCRTNALNQ